MRWTQFNATASPAHCALTMLQALYSVSFHPHNNHRRRACIWMRKLRHSALKGLAEWAGARCKPGLTTLCWVIVVQQSCAEEVCILPGPGDRSSVCQKGFAGTLILEGRTNQGRHCRLRGEGTEAEEWKCVACLGNYKQQEWPER